jgi:hypothetical protein
LQQLGHAKEDVGRLEHVVEGDRVSEVLSYVEYDRADLIKRIRQHTERAVRGSGLTCLALEARHVKGVARPVPVFDVILNEDSSSSTTSMDMPTLPFLART